MLVNREATKKKKTEGEKVGCIGTVELPEGIYHTKTGSGYDMLFLELTPDENTDGIPATFNLMFHPDWLQEDFDPTIFDVGLVALAKAKARIKRAKKEGNTPLAADLELDKNGRRGFVYQMNIYDSKGASTLQTLLGDSFDSFIEGLDVDTSEEFLQSLKDVHEDSDSSLFLYECSQRVQAGELVQQMQVTDFSRVGKFEDIEEWASKRRLKGTSITFDVDAFEIDDEEDVEAVEG